MWASSGASTAENSQLYKQVLVVSLIYCEMAVWPAAAPKTHTDPRCVDGCHARNKPLRRCVCRVGTGMSGSRIGSKLGILPWARHQVVAESLGEVAILSIVPRQGSSAPTPLGHYLDTWRRDSWHPPWSLRVGRGRGPRLAFEERAQDISSAQAYLDRGGVDRRRESSVLDMARSARPLRMTRSDTGYTRHPKDPCTFPATVKVC